MADQTPGTFLGQLVLQAAPEIAPAVGAQANAWTQALGDYVSKAILPKVPAGMQGAVIAALGAIQSNSALIEGTTAQGFLALATHLAMGADDQARLVWLASGAPIDAVLDQLDADALATQTAAQSRADTWDQIKSVALEFLKVGGQVALPMLLAFI